MDGVTILNIIEVTGVSKNVIIATLICFVVALFITFILKVSEDSIFDIFLLILLIGDVFGLFACFFVGTYQIENHKTGEIQYEVTVDNSVSMTEFNKKYEIIEQRGDIFVVKERK